MVQSVLSNPTLSLLEKVAQFGERRHGILAGNVANINTPYYRMRDLPVADFQQALKQAVEGARRPHAAGPVAPPDSASAASGAFSGRSLDALFPERLFEAELAPPRNLTFQDANNRSIEKQVMELTKNTMMQNFAVELLRFQMSALQAVISERP